MDFSQINKYKFDGKFGKVKPLYLLKFNYYLMDY